MTTEDAELSLSPETAFYILEKAREFDEKVEAMTPDDGSNPTDDGGVAVLEDLVGDPTYEELVAAIESLNDDELTDLVALMWLGRGDYALDEWDECRRMARERRTGPVAAYLAGQPLASDYLEEGLALLGHTLASSEAGKHL